jgi:hypothetical protein
VAENTSDDATAIGLELNGFLDVSVVGAAIYGIAVLLCIVATFWVAGRGRIRFEPRKFVYSVTLFILLGATGEAFLNSMWDIVFGWPLWEYRLYPAHGGDISLFFPMIWGIFGTYSYLRDQVVGGMHLGGGPLSMVVIGAEAILLELSVNMPYGAIFGDYILSYTPANLGPFSHYSWLQFIPFYAAIAVATLKLTEVQEIAQYRHMRATLLLYVIGTLSFGTL